MDRWDDIVAGMDALAHQTVPPLETILVVDHNDGLLARARDEFPDVRVLDNPRTGGASGARNTGIAQAKGSIIAFVDDDATPEPDWIEQLLAAYDDEHVMAVGGVATPVWPSRRPDHLPPELDWIVGCTYQGQPTVRTDVRNLWGCNMSVRQRGLRAGRHLRRAGRPDRPDPARRRGDRALHPHRPADPRRPGGLRAAGARPPPGHRGPHDLGLPALPLARRGRLQGRHGRRSSGPADGTSRERLRAAGAAPRRAPRAGPRVSRATSPASAARRASSPASATTAWWLPPEPDRPPLRDRSAGRTATGRGAFDA